MIDEDEALIHSVLGDKIQPLSLTVGDRQWHGWERQITQQEPLPILLSDKNFRTEQEILANFVEQSWRSFHQRNIRLWSSFG